MPLNFDFVIEYLSWYVDAAVLTVTIAFWGILFFFWQYESQMPDGHNAHPAFVIS